ncbi:MAG: hypothetical protein B6242_17150, partial [Anaerolineaceae bacterium 4572_78]
SSTRDVAISGDYAYVADAGNGLVILKHTNGKDTGSNICQQGNIPQVAVDARNPATGECKMFGNRCQIPSGWIALSFGEKCDSSNDNVPLFIDSGQELITIKGNSKEVALGDVDGDGDLDAFVANYGPADAQWGDTGEPNKVWLNDGFGIFTDSGQNLGNSLSFGLALGDVDNDGDLDAFVANTIQQPNKIWLNDGTGIFTDSGQNLGNSYSFGIALSDVDNDNDLDAVVANAIGEPNKVWLNDSSGIFTDSGQNLGNSRKVALGDVDGDGNLDIVVANNGKPNKVWLNNGSGTFSDSGQNLGNFDSWGIALGDVDGDSDLDILVANNDDSSKVWLNNGSGVFTDSGQEFDNSTRTGGIAVDDVDGDGDLDSFIIDLQGSSEVWLNNGSGTFIDSEQNLGNSSGWGIVLGDVDGDSDLDAFIANHGANKVWLNQSLSSSNNVVPVATDVNVTGTVIKGKILTGEYAFSDDEDDAEGTSTFQWYQAISDYVGPVYIPNEPPKVESPTPNSGDVLQELDNISLSWTGSDPDGDAITYNVFLGGILVDHCANISTSTCTLQETLELGTSYFWEVKAKDSHGNPANGGPWGFSIRGNQRPDSPVTYQPEYGKTGINYAGVDLQWAWEDQPDPDGDTVTCDVYLSTDKSKVVNLSLDSLICQDVSSAKASCQYPGFEAGKTYHWRVVTKDEFGSISKGFFGMFETQSFEAAFEVNQENGFAPLTINFTDISTGSIQSWLWDFGVQKENSTENETSSDQHPKFTFKETGTYPVTLTVKDVDGQEKTVSKEITVNTLVEIPLVIKPSDSSMDLDWEDNPISGSVGNVAKIAFYRTTGQDGQPIGNWEAPFKTCGYNEGGDCSKILTGHYFDKDDSLIKGTEYCYYFEALDTADNILTRSSQACNVYGTVVLSVDSVPSAANGSEVEIPVRIFNAEGLQMCGGEIWIQLDGNVIEPNTIGVEATTLTSDLYDFEVWGTEVVPDSSRVKVQVVFFPTDDSNPAPILYGTENSLFKLMGTVIGTDGMTTSIDWEEETHILQHVKDENGMVSCPSISLRKSPRQMSLRLYKGTFTVGLTGNKGDPGGISGKVDIGDKSLIMNHVVGSINFTPEQFVAADVNGNGQVDANDATQILYRARYGKWLALPSQSSGSAQDESPVIISLDDFSGESGTEVETTLRAENLSDWTSGEFTIAYDPEVIAEFTQIKRAGLANRASVAYHDDGTGLLHIAIVNRDPINGSGELATLTVRLKAKTMLRRGTRDGAATGKRSASLVLTQTQLYDPSGQNFVTSKLQRVVERQNAEVVRTDVPEEIDDDETDTGTGDDSTSDNDAIVTKPKVMGHILDKLGDPILCRRR